MTTRQLTALSATVLGITATSLAQAPLGTEFTYQGQLKGNDIPAISTADFQFSLFDDESAGATVAAMLLKENVGIVNGLFTVSLDFGADALNGDARWLEVTVRSPAGSGGFATLSPRQPLTAAPYALQTRGITVDENLRVGIGTTTPAKNLTVAGDMELGTSSGDYRHMRIGGGNSDGFLYGSFPGFGDGIHMGYNYYADAAGNDQIVHSDGGTSRISMGYGSIVLATAGQGGSPPVNQVTIDQNGDMHINGLITFPPILRSYTVHALEFMNDPNNSQFQSPAYGFGGVRDFSEPCCSSFYVACPHLPNGATIVAMEMSGFDDGPENMFCKLGRTDFNGDHLKMAEVESLTGGPVWQTTDILFPTVDNDTHAYWLVAELKGNAFVEHRLTAVRLIYSITGSLP